ncbi:MAG: hypothetical protein ACRDTZ_08940 [Pseudonocardiaceae bacterium]
MQHRDGGQDGNQKRQAGHENIAHVTGARWIASDTGMGTERAGSRALPGGVLGVTVDSSHHHGDAPVRTGDDRQSRACALSEIRYVGDHAIGALRCLQDSQAGKHRHNSNKPREVSSRGLRSTMRAPHAEQGYDMWSAHVCS